MQYISVSGGVTGYRESTLKDKVGGVNLSIS